MLQNIRDNIQGTAAKVIIALIVVPFALFGIDSLFNTSSQAPVAVVNGEKISERELVQTIALQKRRLINMMGDNIDPAMLDDALLRRPALDSLVKKQLLLQAADDVNIEISEQQLNSLIVTMPQFQENGRFSQERYDQILRLQGYSSQFFKQLLRTDLVIQQISSAVSASSFVTDADLKQAVALLHESRDFQYIPVPLKPIEAAVTVSDAELQQWYNDHSQDYLSDEQVKFSYIELDESQFYEPVSEEAVQREYESVIAASNAVTEREAAHILFERGDDQSEEAFNAEIAEVQKRLAAGEAFADLAKQYSADLGSASNGGELGFTSGDSYPAEFEAALAELEVGNVSQPVSTDAGVHLIKLLSIREPEVPSIDQLRAEITDRLRKQAARPKLMAAVERLRDLVFNAEDLAMPAKEMNLTVAQSPLMARGESGDLFAYDVVKQAAFSRELREQKLNSEVMELADNRFLVLHIDEYKAPEALPLASVRDDIVEQLKRNKAVEMAQSEAKQMASQLEEGGRAEDVAKAEGKEWKAVVDSKRNTLGVDVEVLKKVFAMPRPDAQARSVATLQKSDGDWVVIHLLGAEPGEIAALDAPAREEVKKTIANGGASQSFSAYFNSLWNNAEVKIN
jgi:peptidyl-prolyl cis-trans isomerase D